MKKFFILIPTYNDWKSLNRLLSEISKNIADIKGMFHIIIVNDASTIKSQLKVKKLKKIKAIEIINLKKNHGSQKAICIGLKYLKMKNEKSIITVIDSDGEDDPSKIKELIKLARNNPKYVVTANRLSRTENILLRFINICRLLLTYILTGKYIDFGNFSSFSSLNLNKILSNHNVWRAYSAGIASNCKNVKNYFVKKKKRYFGISKVSFLFLITHSANIISVFKKEIFFRSILLLFIIFLLVENTNLFLMITLVFASINYFNFFNNSLSLFNNCLKQIKNIKKIKP